MTTGDLLVVQRVAFAEISRFWGDAVTVIVALLVLFITVPAVACTRTVEFAGARYEVCVADYNHYSVRTFWKNDEGKPYQSLSNLWGHLKSQSLNPVFLTNAGIYMDDLTPLGLYVENGKTLRPLNTAKGLFGNFYMQPNGVFITDNKGIGSVVETTRLAHWQRNIRYATQSGPMLLINGTINPKFKKDSPHRLIRSGIGATANEIIIVKSIGTVSFYDIARLFREKFGVLNALYLDGNISDTMTVDHGASAFAISYGAMIAVIQK
ncbi:MAG: phosphodiester glycosidase family protein [Rhodospirillaceae bacterium]